MSPLTKTLLTVGMLFCSNTFMTMAWYGLLNPMRKKLWILAVLACWGIAFFEYLIMVPANRLGSEVMSVSQLKITQEAISLCVFIPFAYFVIKEHITWNYLWAGLCILGAVFFIFRK